MKKYWGVSYTDKHGRVWTREKDGGVPINFIADKLDSLFCYVMGKTLPYILTTELTDEDFQINGEDYVQ